MTAQIETEFRVFDVCHNVVNPALSPAPRVPGVASKLPSVESLIDYHLERMERGGVEKAALNATVGYRKSRGLIDTQEQNDYLAAYRDQAPERFPAAFGVVDPQHADDALPEIDRCAHQLRLTGITFHARWQGVSTEYYWILRYVDRIIEMGMVPTLVAMGESPEENLWKVAYVAKLFPEQDILLRCVFSTWEGTSEAFEVAEECPNLYFDTALAYDYDMIEPFIKIMGSDRVLFGTDLYSPEPPRPDPAAQRDKFTRRGAMLPPMRISHLKDQLIESSLADEQKRQVLWANAMRVFKLEDTPRPSKES